MCQCPLGLKLLRGNGHKNKKSRRFQCPLGLIPHFYQTARVTGTLSKAEVSMPSRAYTSFLPDCGSTIAVVDPKFQCPLGLIPHFYRPACPVVLTFIFMCFNALSGLYLISTVPLQKPRFYAVSRTCFCRYLSEYSDNSCFSCMLTFWTYLMRCNYPRHWIKYSTNYNRCHPIFSLS